jgi:hypothetical protein
MIKENGRGRRIPSIFQGVDFAPAKRHELGGIRQMVDVMSTSRHRRAEARLLRLACSPALSLSLEA